ncbi:MAG: GHKL domain-containing protein [Lachnospiraceae bacterium]|jgi:Signal transduction histidine kinase regulating citrate/malate metabolism
MIDCMDFLNKYVMGSAQMLIGFHFFARLLHKSVRYYEYLLFFVCGILEIHFGVEGRLAEFGAYTLLLVASGFWLCAKERQKLCCCQKKCFAQQMDERELSMKENEAEWKSIILYAALTIEVMQLSFGIVNTLLGILFPIMRSFDQNIIGIVFMFLGYLAALPLSVFCYYITCQYFSYYEREMIEKQSIRMVLIPILLIFLVGEHINFIFYEVADTTEHSDILVPTRHYLMLVIQVLGMASLFCILFAYKKLLQNFRLHTKLFFLEQEERSLNQYVEEAKAHYEKTKSFRHDIKNHITVVKDLLQYGKLDQALNYMKDIEGMTGELSFSYSTNNPVVDILLANKLGIAKSKKIAVYCSLMLPYPCLVRDIDFCIILSNALDNAIYACKQMKDDVEKYINVAGRMKGDFLLLEVENSFQGSTSFTRGIGLSNIKAVAEKYHGAMHIKTQSTTFYLNVLLIIPQHSESSSQQMGSFTDI